MSILDEYCRNHNVYVRDTVPRGARNLRFLQGLYAFRYYAKSPVCVHCMSDLKRTTPGIEQRVVQDVERQLRENGLTWDDFIDEIKRIEGFY